MDRYRKGAHTIYDIKYHIVWKTKYSYGVLKGDIARENALKLAVFLIPRANFIVILLRQPHLGLSVSDALNFSPRKNASRSILMRFPWGYSTTSAVDYKRNL